MWHEHATTSRSPDQKILCLETCLHNHKPDTYFTLFLDCPTIIIPIKTEGRFRDCIIAYAKNYQDRLAITVIPRFLTNLIQEGESPLGEQVWEDTQLVLPDELSSLNWINAITDQPVIGEGTLLAGKIFEHFPAGLLL
jgi:maltooligosyltrehalose synthase